MNFLPKKTDVPSKLLEQIAFNTKPKMEEHMLIVMDKSTHEQHLSEPLQTKNRRFEITFTFLTGCNGIINVANSSNKFYFKRTITNEDDFFEIAIPPGAYEIESLSNEIRRILIDKGHHTEDEYAFMIKPNFSTPGSFIEKSPQGPIIGFVFDDSIKNLLGFHEAILNKEYNLSPNPVDFLSFDNIFLECDIAKGTIFKRRKVVSFTISLWTSRLVIVTSRSIEVGSVVYGRD